MAESDNHSHESLIKTPKQLVTVLALAFVVPIIVIYMLAVFVTAGIKADPEAGALSGDAVRARIKPVADVAIGESGTVEKGQRGGEMIVKQVCAACHETGAANAPKIGDKGAWAKYLPKGQKGLVAAAIKGTGAMPPRGGDPSLTDVELERAIVWMANRAGAGFKEPPAPKPAAKAADKGEAKK